MNIDEVIEYVALQFVAGSPDEEVFTEQIEAGKGAEVLHTQANIPPATWGPDERGIWPEPMLNSTDWVPLPEEFYDPAAPGAFRPGGSRVLLLGDYALGPVLTRALVQFDEGGQWVPTVLLVVGLDNGMFLAGTMFYDGKAHRYEHLEQPNGSPSPAMPSELGPLVTQLLHGQDVSDELLRLLRAGHLSSDADAFVAPMSTWGTADVYVTPPGETLPRYVLRVDAAGTVSRVGL